MNEKCAVFLLMGKDFPTFCLRWSRKSRSWIFLKKKMHWSRPPGEGLPVISANALKVSYTQEKVLARKDAQTDR